jgi:hypothetical protein
MRHAIAITIVLGITGLEGIASADYGAKGVIEVGGSISTSHMTTTMEFDATGQEAEITKTSIEVAPMVAYFVAPGVYVGVAPFISHDITDSDGDTSTETTLGVRVAGAYLINGGKVYYGPILAVGVENLGVDESESMTMSGFDVGGGLLLRVPVGKHGLVGGGVTYNFMSLSGEYADMDLSSSVSGLDVSLEFGLFF